MSQRIHPLPLNQGLSVLLILSLCWFGCSTQEANDHSEESGLIKTTVGGVEIELELAITRPQQTRGLMHREYLPENQGMLFIFDEPSRRSFWMKNTLIPLDIAYIDSDGVIREVHKLYPNDQNSVRSYSDQIQYALEMNQDWFQKNGIKPGDSIDLAPAL